MPDFSLFWGMKFKLSKLLKGVAQERHDIEKIKIKIKIKKIRTAGPFLVGATNGERENCEELVH